MPTSTDIVLVCPVHGRDQKPFEVDRTKFCARCVRDYLASGTKHRPISILEMREVEKHYEVNNPSGPKTYCACGHSWHGGATACAVCGKQDHLPVFSAESWSEVRGKRHAIVRWPHDDHGNPTLRKRDVKNRPVVIDGEVYRVLGVETHAVAEPACLRHPVGLLVERAGNEAE